MPNEPYTIDDSAIPHISIDISQIETISAQTNVNVTITVNHLCQNSEVIKSDCLKKAKVNLN